MKILVVGCADSIWDDVKNATNMATFDKVYCVKLAGVYWPGRFDVWATLHPEYMDDYEAHRSSLGLPNGYEIVAPRSDEVGEHGRKGKITRRVSYRWPGMNSSASSGIYGAKVALDDCPDARVVLAGIPLTASPHFTRGPQPWAQLGSFTPGFETALPFLEGKVKSMSGLTMEKLGKPDAEWLAGG